MVFHIRVCVCVSHPKTFEKSLGIFMKIGTNIVLSHHQYPTWTVGLAKNRQEIHELHFHFIPVILSLMGQ